MEGLAQTVSKSSCSAAQHPGAACAVWAGAQPGTVLTRQESLYWTPGCQASHCLHSMAHYTPQNATRGQFCNPRSIMSGTPGSCALNVPVKAKPCRCFRQGRGPMESQGLAQLLFTHPPLPWPKHQSTLGPCSSPESSRLSPAPAACPPTTTAPGNVAQQNPSPSPGGTAGQQPLVYQGWRSPTAPFS